MQPVLSASAMREADRLTIEDIGIPGFTLMESAGREAARVVLDWLDGYQGAGPRSSFGILCGKGNNGGDGLVMARYLADQGVPVRVWMVQGREGLSEDAATNLEILQRMELPSLRWVSSFQDLERSSVLVDAILGTGVTSVPRPPLPGIIDRINAHPGFVVSLDLPTGLHADTGEVMGEAVRASLTITMGAAKSGLLLGAGPEHAGHLETIAIGIPRHILVSQSATPGSGRLLDDAAVSSTLPDRRHGDHKYSTGPCLVIGGSRRYPGAPVLASQAAARIGAGYVVASLPEDVPYEGSLEIPVVRHQDEEQLAQWLDRSRGVLIGPGLGRGPVATQLVAHVLQLATCPVVVDADGLHAVAELGLRSGGRPWLWTPHAGEFRRLVGTDVDLSNPLGAARHWAAEWNVVLLLKGSPTVIAHPDGRTVICPLGGPSLATAGTGDVLAGLCVGLLSMGLEPFEAAACAAHVGGASADRYTRTRGRSSLMAGDIIRQIPLVLSERFQH